MYNIKINKYCYISKNVVVISNKYANATTNKTTLNYNNNKSNKSLYESWRLIGVVGMKEVKKRKKKENFLQKIQHCVKNILL